MSKEVRMIKGKLYKEESAGNWEPMETTAINDAGVAYRSIQRLLLSINDIEIKKAGLTRSELNPLVEALDTLQAIKNIEQKALEEELHPKGWLEAANADGELFDEYFEVPKKSIAEAKINNVIDIKQ
tara:strand:+ start:2632 stop:3012 length:381 start_codon:yes stop_codon:yes gene_type:complete